MQFGGLPHRVVAVDRRTDDEDPGQQPDQGDQALPDHLLVVRDQDQDRLVSGRFGHDATGSAGSCSRTPNPASVGPAVSLPPSNSARSRMPVRP